MKKYIKTIRITAVILVILLLISVYLFAFNLKASNRINHDLMEFEYTYDDEDSGFIDANTLSNENNLVASNSNFELYLDETTSHFSLLDLETNERLDSNPVIETPNEDLANHEERQLSTMQYRYFNTNGSRSNRSNNYRRSIYHEETPEVDAGYRTFKIKEVENGFQVFYRVTNLEIDYLYFPKYLTKEQMEPVLELPRTDFVRRAVMNAYWDVIDDETGHYEARNYEKMTTIVREELYEVFYNIEFFGEYSRDQSIEENAQNGYFEEIVKFGFDIAVQVLLTNSGIEVKVINESIKEYSESKLAEITLYPYFGTAVDIDPISNNETEGYLVIPDGSGAILEFNNGKTASSSYSKRLYGRNMGMLPYEMPESEEKILMPLFGMIKENIGYSAIITEGDTQASILASVSGVSDDKYNRIYTEFKLREMELAVMGSGWNTHEINLWTKDLIKTDITIQYNVLTNSDNNYVGVANSYKEYLMEQYGITIDDNLEKKTVVEFLGAYDRRKMILGVPYNSMASLTNYNEAMDIIEELSDLGVDELDVIFSGVTNGGLDNNLEKKVKFEKQVGSKKKFNSFEKELNEKNINVYPTANFFSTNNFSKPLEIGRYSTNRIRGDRSVIFDYHIPTRLPYSETSYDHKDEHVPINPRYYENLYKKYNKSYEFTNLALTGIGSNLAGHYKKNKVIDLHESIEYQKNLIEMISENQNIAISEPFSFTYGNLDLAFDLPLESTIYTILDYRIPLVQLVLSGLSNYTHKSINLASTRDIDYQFLKVLENGSSLKYTLSYKNSLELLETEHNQYMSTEYTNWLDLMEEQHDVIKSNGLLNARITEHERLRNNVFKTTYSNGVYIITNYNLTQTNVDGILIDSLDYHVGGGS